MKRIFASAVSILICATSFAQFGITGGLTSTASDIRVAAKELSTKNLSQYHVGVTYKFSIGKVFAIQPALIYNVKGAKLCDIHSLSDIKFKTGYLELPVQVQAGVSLGKIVRLYGIADPFLGYALTNTIKAADASSSTWENIKNRVEYGIGLGAGIELFKHLQINLRYFWNFGTIYGADITIASVTTEIANSTCRGISLSAVVLF